MTKSSPHHGAPVLYFSLVTLTCVLLCAVPLIAPAAIYWLPDQHDCEPRAPCQLELYESQTKTTKQEPTSQAIIIQVWAPDSPRDFMLPSSVPLRVFERPRNCSLATARVHTVSIFLRYIINAYDSLKPYNVFLWEEPKEVLALRRVVARHPAPRDLISPGDCAGRDFVMCDARAVGVSSDPHSNEFSAFVKRLGRPVPGLAPVSCFGVSSSRIRGRSHEEYKTLLALLEDPNLDETAREILADVIESAWFALLSPPYDVRVSALLISSPSSDLLGHRPLHALLQSLQEAHWHLPVVVVAGGQRSQDCAMHCDVPEYVSSGRSRPFPVTVVEASTHSFDLTSLIAVVNCSDVLSALPLHSAVFLLHDTTWVSANFTRSVDAISLGAESDAQWLEADDSLNMGVYGVSGLLRVRSVLERLYNADTSASGLIRAKAAAVASEDVVFKTLVSLGAVVTVVPSVRAHWIEPARDVYNTGTLRVVHRYEPLGLSKAQANYGQNPPGSWVLLP